MWGADIAGRICCKKITHRKQSESLTVQAGFKAWPALKRHLTAVCLNARPEGTVILLSRDCVGFATLWGGGIVFFFPPMGMDRKWDGESSQHK